MSLRTVARSEMIDDSVFDDAAATDTDAGLIGQSLLRTHSDGSWGPNRSCHLDSRTGPDCSLLDIWN